MRKLFVTAGHGGLDTGAVFGDYIERDLNIDFRDLVIKELKALGINALTDSNQNALKQTLAWLRGKFVAEDILVDIHFNAGMISSHGTEVLVPEDASDFEKRLAASITKVFASVGFSNRGVKSEAESARKRLGWMRSNAETVLIEVCFITNLTDMKLYEANKNGLARKLAALLKDYSNI